MREQSAPRSGEDQPTRWRPEKAGRLGTGGGRRRPCGGAAVSEARLRGRESRYKPSGVVVQFGIIW